MVSADDSKLDGIRAAFNREIRNPVKPFSATEKNRLAWLAGYDAEIAYQNKQLSFSLEKDIPRGRIQPRKSAARQRSFNLG